MKLPDEAAGERAVALAVGPRAVVDRRAPGAVRAVIPMKPLADSKQRLAEALDPGRRAALSLWMLERVIRAARASMAVGEVVVIGGDAAVAALCEELEWRSSERRRPAASSPLPLGEGEGEGVPRPLDHRIGAAAVRWEQDLEGDLNRALDAARLASGRRGWEAMLFLAGDLPWLAPEEVAELVAAKSHSELVLAPGLRGGTNAIIVPCGLEFRFQLGSDSFHLHRQQAQHLGLEGRAFRAPGLEADVDLPEDLARLERAVPHLWQVAPLPIQRLPTPIVRTP